MSKPACFDTQQQYDDWLDTARKAKEQASPCGDCSGGFQYAMRKQDRCDKKTVRIAFSYIPASATKKEITPA